MNRLLLTMILLLQLFGAKAQECSNNCEKNYHNTDRDISVGRNEVVCLTGTFKGNIKMKGGELYVCANATIYEIEVTNPSSIYLMPVQTTTIQTINANNNILSIHNFSDSVIIQNGNFNSTFQLFNFGKLYCNFSNFNNRVEITNSGNLVFSNGLNLNNTGSIFNTKFMKIVGRLNMNNPGVIINSSCNFEITGGLNLGGQQLMFDNNGIFKLNGGLNINSGSITLKDATMMQVDNMTVGGYIEGIGGRSTIECTNAPNLNQPGSIKGNISLCVKTGTFNPNSGTVVAPATVDCNNPLGSNDCRDLGTSNAGEIFRLKTNNATDWNNSSNWEMFFNNQWQNAPLGRYPMKGASVFIDGNKKINIIGSVLSKSITLGNATSYGIIESTTGSNMITSTDSLNFANPNSLIKIAGLTAAKNVSGTIQLFGSSSTKLILNLNTSTSGTVNLKMDNSTSGSSKLSELNYNIGAGTLLLMDTLKITRSIQPITGTLNTNNKLILLSDNQLSASILKGSGNYLTGKVKIQDYIPAIARRYRFLSSPVGTNLKDWQEEVFITGNNSAGNATGTTPGLLNSAGFDATPSNNPGIYYYDETVSGHMDNGWMAITNETNTLADIPLVIGKGYRMFIRGDRSDIGRLDGTNQTQNEVTLDLYGNIHTGDFNFPLLFSSSGLDKNNGWNLVGNPYPAAYDFKTFYETEEASYDNIDPTIWIYNAKTNSYVSYNFRSEAGSMGGGIIPPGQSFWIKANRSNPILTWHEKYKISDNGVDYRSVEQSTDEIKFTLIKDSINSDQLIIKYMNGATKLKDEYDIEKFWSSIGIGTFGTDSVYLDLSARPIDYYNTDFVPVYFYVDASGTYKLEIQHNLNQYTLGSSLYLLDDYTQQYINLKTNPSYTFTVDKNIPATENYNRFYLVYLPAVPSPTNITYFIGERDKSNVLLNWGTDIEPFPLTMDIERGETFNSFQKIGSISGTGSTIEGADYEFIDSTAIFNNQLYYRLILNDSIYGNRPSTIIMLDYTGIKSISAKENLFNIYPNPVHAYATLNFAENSSANSYNIKIYTINGLLCYSLKTETTSNAKIIIPTELLRPGMYFIEATDKEGKVSNAKFIKE